MTDKTLFYIRALEAEKQVYTECLDMFRHKGTQIAAAMLATQQAKDALIAESHGPATPTSTLSSPLQYHRINGETILVVCLYGANRPAEVTEWNRRVMVDYLGIPVNYIQCPFPAVSHGACMNQVLSQTLDLPAPPDYYLFVDNDAIFMRHGVMDLVHQIVANKMTIFGQAWMNNHKVKPRGVVHAYASQATLCFPRSIYNALGRPDMDHWVARSDTAEELTYAAKEKGYFVNLLYPSHVTDPNTPLDASCFQGFGNTYGPNLMFHASQTGNPRHVELFVDTCKRVVAGEFEPK